MFKFVFQNISQRARLTVAVARAYMQNVALNKGDSPYLPEFILRLSINNQVTLGLQQVTRAPRLRYDSASKLVVPDEVAEYYKSGHAAYDRAKNEKYDYKSVIVPSSFGKPLRKWEKTEKRSLPNLDLTEKFQRGKKLNCSCHV